MLHPHQLETLLEQVKSVLPANAVSLHDDLEKNLKTVLESALHRMNLVTREEFDVQMAVLQRTREHVDALSKQVAALETQLAVNTEQKQESPPKE